MASLTKADVKIYEPSPNFICQVYADFMEGVCNSEDNPRPKDVCLNEGMQQQDFILGQDYVIDSDSTIVCFSKKLFPFKHDDRLDFWFWQNSL